MKISKEDLILQSFDRVEKKIDKLMEEIVPQLKTDMAVMKTKSSNTAAIITGIGGAITLAVSVAAAHWMR